MKSKKNIILLVFIIVLGLIFIFLNKSNSSNNEENLMATSTTILDVDGATIEIIPTNTPSINAPTLDRKLTGLTPLTKTQLKDIEQILKDDPLNIDGWMDIASIWKAGGDFNGAKEAWEYVLLIQPNHYVASFNIGNLYANELNDLDKAEFFYRQALESNASYLPIYFQSVEMYLYKFNDKEKALNIIDEGLKNLPNDSDLLELRDTVQNIAL